MDDTTLTEPISSKGNLGHNSNPGPMTGAMPAMTPPAPNLPPPGRNVPPASPKKPQGHSAKPKPWKSIVAAVLTFIIGVSIGSCGSQDPKTSAAYKELEGQYSQTSKELKQYKAQATTSQQALASVKSDLKKAQEKADKWDKEQADKKAEEDKAKQEKEAQEQAAKQAQEEEEEEAKRSQEQAQAQAQEHTQAQQRAWAPPAQQPQQPGPGTGRTVHRGAFCSPEGATGSSDQNGATLTCRVARDGRLRWMN